MTSRNPHEIINLESRIYTCSVKDYLALSGYKKREIELIGVHSNSKIGAQHSDILNSKLYSNLAIMMKENGYVAITDVRISHSYILDQGTTKVQGIIYGTAIKKIRDKQNSGIEN